MTKVSGARSRPVCPICGATTGKRHRFCHACGASLAAPSATPEHLEQRVRNADIIVDGERKQVTILFADIVGSTELIRDADPESAAALLDPPLQAMTRAVRARGGLVVRIQGDGIMALFGAPAAQEDHAVRACEAALDLRDSIAALSVPVRIGLSSGEVVLRAIRNDLVVDYDAVGSTVHLAARMEQRAESGTICISAATASLVRGMFVVRPLGVAALKGVGDKIEAFELTARNDESSRWRARVARGLGTFVGRTVELERIATAAIRAQRGAGQLVVVTAEVGLGKSRLVHEALLRIGGAGWEIRDAAAGSEDTGTSYRPLAAMLRRWLAITPDTRQEAISRKLERALDELGPDLGRLLDPLLSVLDVPVTSPRWRTWTPTRRRQTVLDAFCTLCQRWASHKPLLILFEDAHWFDAESRAVLCELAARIGEYPILILVTGRPELAEVCVLPETVISIKLEPLGAQETYLLAEALLGSSPAVAGLTQKICQRALGVPLFLEEIVQNLSDTGVLSGRLGQYELRRSASTISVPATVQAVLSERFDHLRPGLKHLLQVAATIGQVTTIQLLSAVLDRREANLIREVATLATAGFVVAIDEAGEPGFVFKHPLMQLVVYEMMVQERRRTLHAAVARAIERVFAHRLEEQVETLAHHTMEGALWDDAVRYQHRAAIRAADRSAYSEAVRRIEAALSIQGQLAEAGTHAAIGEQIAMRSTLHVALGALGRYREVLDGMDAIEELARTIGDTARLMAVRVSRIHLLNLLGNTERAIQEGERVYVAAQMQGDINHIVAAGYFLSQAKSWRGDARGAIAAVEETLPHVESRPEDYRFGMTGTPSVLLRAQLAHNHTALGAFDLAVRYGEQAWQAAERLGRDFDRCIAAQAYGSALANSGDLSNAVAVLEAGLQAGDASEITVLSSAVAGNLCHAHLLRNDHAQALRCSARAMVVPEFAAYPQCWPSLYRAWALAETGATAEAMALVARVRTLAEDHGYLAIQAWNSWLAGAITRSIDPSAAIKHFIAAARLARQLGLVPLLSRCEHDFAAAADATGHNELSLLEA